MSRVYCFMEQGSRFHINTRFLHILYKERRALYDGYRKICSAKTRVQKKDNVVERFHKHDRDSQISFDNGETKNKHDNIDGTSKCLEGKRKEHPSTYLKAISELQTTEDDNQITFEVSSAYYNALLNVMKQRCTDVTVWSILFERIHHLKHISQEWDLNMINKILYRMDRYICNNAIISSKLKNITSILLERVNDLVTHNLNMSILDLKLRSSRTKIDVISDETSRRAAFNEQTENSDHSGLAAKQLDLNEIWKMWYILNSSDRVSGRKTEQLLLELMLHKRQEMRKFDLGRSIRSLNVILQRRRSLTLAEEKLASILFSQLCVIFSRNPMGPCYEDKSPIQAVCVERGYSKDPASVACYGENYTKLFATDADNSFDSSQSHSDINLKEGNIYLTIGHVHDVLHALLSMHMKFSKDRHLRLISSNLWSNGLQEFMNKAEDVVKRSLDLEARLRQSAITMGSCETTLKDVRKNQFFGGIRKKHLKILGIMIELLKKMDADWLQKISSTNLESVRDSLSRLCSKTLGRLDTSDLKANLLHLKCAYYMLLSSLMRASFKLGEAEKVLSTATTVIDRMMKNNSTREEEDIMSISVWIEKLISLARELEIASPVLRNLVDCHKASLRNNANSCVNQNTLGLSIASSILLIRMMQKEDLLNEDTLLKQLHVHLAGGSHWMGLAGRDIAMLCEVLSHQTVQGSFLEPLVRELFNQTMEGSEYASMLSLSKLNDEQLLTVANCCHKHFGHLCNSIVEDLNRRGSTMNLRQCVRCLPLAQGELLDALKQRIVNLLKSKETILDLSPVLQMLSNNMSNIDIYRHSNGEHDKRPGEEEMKQTDKSKGVNNLMLPEELAKWLLSIILALDREIIILSDSEYLRRRLEKRFYRYIGGIPPNGETEVRHQLMRHALVSKHEYMKFIEFYKFVDGLKQSTFYRNVNLSAG